MNFENNLFFQFTYYIARKPVKLKIEFIMSICAKRKPQLCHIYCETKDPLLPVGISFLLTSLVLFSKG